MKEIDHPDVVSFAPYALAKKPELSSGVDRVPVWISGMVPADEEGGSSRLEMSKNR